jgi:flavin-dependent dehydrogenase
MATPTEFLIIGGGPAGSSTAIQLARRRREVVVVEETHYDRPRFGETLPSAANPVLDRLGLTVEALAMCGVRCPGSASAWGSGELRWNDAVFDPDGEGIHLDRLAFDRLLAGLAATAGADVRTGQTLRSCRRVGRIWAVTMSGPQGERELLASNLIDATGRASWPGRPSQRRAFDRQVALVQLYNLGDEARLDRRTWIEASPDGWWYSATLPGGRLAAAYFTDADLVRAPRRRRITRFADLLKRTRWTSERLHGALAASEPHVVSASTTIAVPMAGDGWITVGDAASTIDPLSSQGILYAITTGLAAAEALISADRNAALKRYVRAIVARFGADIKTRARFCRRERRWPDSVFWRRRNVTAAHALHAVYDARGA